MPATGQTRDRQSGGCRNGHWALVAAGIGLASLFCPASRAEARLLEVTGEVSLEYRYLSLDTSGSDTSFDTLREMVRAGTGGELFREAIGRWQVNLNFINTDRWRDTRGSSGKSNDQTLDFFVSVGLFPRWMPIALTWQRVTSEYQSSGGVTTGLESLSGETIVTSYGLTWAVPRIWKLPQLNVNLYSNTIETDNCFTGAPLPCKTKVKTFGGSITAADQYPYRYLIKNTELNWSIAFSSFQGVNSGQTDLNVSGLATADSRWTPALRSILRVSSTSGMSRTTSSVPGGVPVTTSAGGSLLYRPSLKLNGSLDYDYTKDLYDRHILGGDVFYRPSPRYDIAGMLRGSFFDLNQTEILSGSGTGTVVFRPILNLTTTFLAGLGGTQTTVQAGSPPRTRGLFAYGSAGGSYFQVYELVRLNTSASLSLNDVMSTGSNAMSMAASWGAQVTNTKTQYVSVTGSYNGYYTDAFSSTNGGVWTNALRADATSNYLRELLLRGDALTLHAGAGDQFATYNHVNNQTVDVGADFHYAWQAVGIGSGYGVHLSTEAEQDSDTIFVELQWAAPPLLSGLSLMLHGRYDLQMFKEGKQPNLATATADVNGGYQIGLFQLNLQYLFSSVESQDMTLSHNLTLRLTRRFSL